MPRATKAARPAAAAAAARKPRARRAETVVLQVPPIMIDTSAVAAAAASDVLQHARPADAAAKSEAKPDGQPAPLLRIKRDSTAFRDAKEAAANPVARQLAHLFGPPPVVQGLLPASFRHDRTSGGRKFTKTYNPHAGHFGVPRRAAG
jgi:hypothetical protein